jgi:hypothetical protein
LIEKQYDLNLNFMSYNIFISHKGEDDDYVQRLKERFKEKGYNVRNGSVDSTKYQDKIPSQKGIANLLNSGINWAGTFICLIGENTHTSRWVNYEIEKAMKLGKTIIGIYTHGCPKDVEIPEALENCHNGLIGWNSLEKVGDIMDGVTIPAENPRCNQRVAPHKTVRIPCNS